MSTVKLESVAKQFNKVSVVNNLSFTVGEGEFFTLLGASGCGKTTTLRMIAGFYYPNEGFILVDGNDVTRLPPNKRDMGMVFQNYALFPHLTVQENLAFGLKVRHLPRKEIRERTDKYLNLVRLDGYADRRIDQLSGGQQQRVALARALTIQPKILLLDEPLSNLDAKLRQEMRYELRNMQKQLGTTTIYVTHDQSEALAMSDKIAVFENGRCSQVGTPTEIYHHPAGAFVAKFLGETNLVPCQIIATSGDSATVKMLGIQVDVPFSGNLDSKKDSWVSVRPEAIGISLWYGKGVRGVVEGIIFNGATIDIVLRCGEIQMRATVLGDLIYERMLPGTDIACTFLNDSLLLVQ